MILKTLMNKPVLAIGILFMMIFVFDLNRRGILFGRADRVQATSCRSVLVMLEKRIPATWMANCNGNNLEVSIENTFDDSKLKNPTDLKRILYRELANNLQFISKNTLNESLERTFLVTVSMNHPKLSISAVSEGQFVAKLATISEPRFIAEHLKATVQVKEKLK